jgi:hypothetical protein
VPACHRFSRDRPAAPALCAEVACRNATKPEWPVDAMLMKSKTDSRDRVGGDDECLIDLNVLLPILSAHLIALIDLFLSNLFLSH